MTTHVWKPNASGFILDKSHFIDGKPFEPGDTVLVHDGSPSIAGANGQQGTLNNATFDFDVTGAQANFAIQNVTFQPHVTIEAQGEGPLNLDIYGNVISGGVFRVGVGAASGQVQMSLDGQSPTQPASFTNSGKFILTNGSLFQLDPFIGGIFFNQGSMQISHGAQFVSTGYSLDSTDDGTFRNDGTILVSGQSGRTTSFDVSGFYTGIGSVTVNGGTNTNAGRTAAIFSDPVSGLNLSLSNGSALFNYTVANSTIQFQNGDASVTIDQLINTATVNIADPFGAKLVGFQQGDAIYIETAANKLSYNATKHVLSVAYNATTVAKLTVEGNFTTQDFKLQNASMPGYVEITLKAGAAAALAGAQLSPADFLGAQAAEAAAASPVASGAAAGGASSALGMLLAGHHGAPYGIPGVQHG